jgi:hypothetical protein
VDKLSVSLENLISLRFDGILKQLTGSFFDKIYLLQQKLNPNFPHKKVLRFI